MYGHELRLETLSGDIRDALLMHFRSARRPWEMLTEYEQREKAEIFERAAENLVRRVVAMVTKFEFPSLPVVLGEVKIKGEKGIEAKIGAANTEKGREILGEAVGDVVILVVASAERFYGEGAPAEIDKDQPDLPIEVRDGA